MKSTTKGQITRINNQIEALEKKKGKPIDAKDIHEGNARFQLHYDCDVEINELREKMEELMGQSV
jgi:hypothetical protein